MPTAGVSSSGQFSVPFFSLHSCIVFVCVRVGSFVSVSFFFSSSSLSLTRSLRSVSFLPFFWGGGWVDFFVFLCFFFFLLGSSQRPPPDRWTIGDAVGPFEPLDSLIIPTRSDLSGGFRFLFFFSFFF